MRVLLLLIFLSGAAGSRASGTAGADLMAVRLGARAAALGDAYTALASDAVGAAYNPAGLASLERLDVTFLHWNAAAEVGYELFSCARPFSFGTPGLSIANRHLPDIANPGAVDPPVTSNDLLIGLSYAYDVTSFLAGQTVAFYPEVLHRLAAGVTLKYLKSHLGSVDASAFAADLGLKAQILDEWTVGLSVLNLGPAIRFIDVADPLPAEILAGVMRSWQFGSSHHVTVVFDLEQPLEDLEELGKGAIRSHLGVEDFMSKVFALRAGWDYSGPQSLGGPTAGMGIKLQQDPLEFTLDYAFRPVYYDGFSSFEGQNLLSVTVGF